MLLLNSYYLYNKNQIRNQMRFYDFRIEVLSTILPKMENSARTLNSVEHTPSTYEEGNNGRPLRKKCKQCSTKGIRKDTIYYCDVRPNKPSLCLITCFKKHHTQ